MFLFTAEASDTFRLADSVAYLDRGQLMPGPIGPSVILNTYNVDLLAFSDGVRLMI